MESIIFHGILVAIFWASSSYSQQFDQQNLIYYEDSSEDADGKIEFVNPYFYHLRNNLEDSLKYRPEWDFKQKYEERQPETDIFETSIKEKKQGHFETLCMNIPVKRKILEENGYDFKPNVLIEHKCQPLPSEGVFNPLLIPDNAQICKVQGGCHTRHREMRIFKKQRNSTDEGHCWEKVNYNLSIGCQCMGHILQPFA